MAPSMMLCWSHVFTMFHLLLTAVTCGPGCFDGVEYIRVMTMTAMAILPMGMKTIMQTVKKG